MVFNRRGNIFVGGNGQGKPTLLEAIRYLSTARSFREHYDRNLVSFGADGFVIEGEYESARMPSERIRIECRSDGGKRVFLNGRELRRISELVGRLKSVVYHNGSREIIKGGPGERRRFCDSLLVQTDRIYLAHLIKYKELLKRRNLLLQEKHLEEDTGFSIDAIDEQMTEPAFYIMSRRKHVLSELSGMVSGVLLPVSSPELTFDYCPSGRFDDLELTPTGIRAMLRKYRTRDIEVGFTNFGPHRDNFISKSGGIDLRIYGSEGEIKTTVLAMKSAEYRYMEKNTGETPVLILDDREADFESSRLEQLDLWVNTSGGQYFTVSYSNSMNTDTTTIFILNDGSTVE